MLYALISALMSLIVCNAMHRACCNQSYTGWMAKRVHFHRKCLLNGNFDEWNVVKYMKWTNWNANVILFKSQINCFKMRSRNVCDAYKLIKCNGLSDAFFYLKLQQFSVMCRYSNRFLLTAKLLEYLMSF